MARRDSTDATNGRTKRPDGVERRALLLGAAASAGAVAASASPAHAAPRQSATRSLVAFRSGSALLTSSSTASEVSVDPAGEIVDDDLQTVLTGLDWPLGRGLVDDQQVAMTLIDDFMGNSTNSGDIGQLGWTRGNPSQTTGSVTIPQTMVFPGVVALGTAADQAGWQSISLGSATLLAGPAFLCEWRVRLSAVNAVGGDAFEVRIGLHDNLSGGEPANGFYFRYAPNNENWMTVCAQMHGLQRQATEEDSGVKGESSAFHRFRIISDGGGSALFYIDGVRTPKPITAFLPNLVDRNTYTPAATIRKAGGVSGRSIAIDYFALRYEVAR